MCPISRSDNFEEFDQAMSLTYKEEAEITQMGTFIYYRKVKEMKYQYQLHFSGR